MTERKWPKWLDILISLGVLAVVIVAGYYGFAALTAAREQGKQDEPEANDRPPVSVHVARVEQRKLTSTFEVVGTVLAEPERFTTLTAATSGLVEKLVVPEGRKVSKGDLIIQLDERTAQTALHKAEATYARLIAKPRTEELAQASALVAKMKSAHALADYRLKRAKELQNRSPDLVSEEQLAALEPELTQLLTFARMVGNGCRKWHDVERGSIRQQLSDDQKATAEWDDHFMIHSLRKCYHTAMLTS